MSFNKMVLISEERLRGLEQAKTEGVRSFLQIKEDELKEIMNDANTDDEERIRKYSDVLRQLVSRLHTKPVDTKPQNTTTMLPELQEKAPEMDNLAGVTEDGGAEDNWEDTVQHLQGVEPNAPYVNSVAKEKALRTHLATHPHVFGKAAGGQLILNGVVIENSNFEELVKDFSNAHKWKATPPVGAGRFAARLQQTNFDRDNIANKSRRWVVALTAGQRGKGAFQVRRWKRC